MLVLLLACAAEPTGPESTGAPTDTTTVLASPGDEGVELLTWALPKEGSVTDISFVLLVPDGDALGATRWVPDVYAYTERSRSLPPVRTVVQDAFELCWLTDSTGTWIGSAALPAGEGEVFFRGLPWVVGPRVTLLCNVSVDADSGSFAVSLHELSSLGPYEDGEFAWRATYGNSESRTNPARRIVIR